MNKAGFELWQLLALGLLLLVGGWLLVPALLAGFTGGDSGIGGNPPSGNPDITVADNRLACEQVRLFLNGTTGKVCASTIQNRPLISNGRLFWAGLRPYVSAATASAVEAGFGNDSLFSFDCSNPDAGPQLSLLRECKGETGANGLPKSCDQAALEADCVDSVPTEQQLERNREACRVLEAYMNPGNLADAHAGTVCAGNVREHVWTNLWSNLSSAQRRVIENGFSADSFFSYDCSNYDQGPQFQLVRECRGEGKVCGQETIHADCRTVEAPNAFLESLANRCAGLSVFGINSFSTCGTGTDAGSVFQVSCSTPNLIPNLFGLWNAEITSREDCAVVGDQCITESSARASCGATACVSFSGEQGLTGRSAAPTVSFYWGWGDSTNELPRNALDPSNPTAVFGDAHQFFMVLFKQMKEMDDLASRDFAANRATIEGLKSHSRFLLKPDNYQAAFVAFASYAQTSDFLAPAWLKDASKPWIKYTENNENGNPRMIFEPAELTEAGEYQIKLEPELDDRLQGFQNEFFMAITGNVLLRYTTIKVKFEKIANPIRKDASDPNPLYLISLNRGLSGEGFGTRFEAGSPENGAPIRLSSELTTQSFGAGNKTVVFQHNQQVEQVNGTRGNILVMANAFEANNRLNLFFYPSQPALLGGMIDESQPGKQLVYQIVQVAPENQPLTSMDSVLVWNWMATTKSACSDFVRPLSFTQMDSKSSDAALCEPTSAYSGPVSYVTTFNDTDATGKVLGQAAFFAPLDQAFSLNSCKGMLSTTEARQDSSGVIRIGETSATQGLDSMEELIQGIKNKSVCVITKNAGGQPLSETRFAWNANAFSDDANQAIEQLGQSNVTWCEPTPEPENACNPLNVDRFNGVRNAVLTPALLDETLSFLLRPLSTEEQNQIKTWYRDRLDDGRMEAVQQRSLVKKLVDTRDFVKAITVAKGFKPDLVLGDCDQTLENHRPAEQCVGIVVNQFLAANVALSPAEFPLDALRWASELYMNRTLNPSLSTRVMEETFASSDHAISPTLQKEVVEFLRSIFQNRPLAERLGQQFCSVGLSQYYYCDPVSVEAFAGVEEGAFDDSYAEAVINYLLQNSRNRGLSMNVQRDYWPDGQLTEYSQRTLIEYLIEPNPGMARNVLIRVKPNHNLGDCDPTAPNAKPSSQCKTQIRTSVASGLSANAAIEESYIQQVFDYLSEGAWNRELGNGLLKEQYANPLISVGFQNELMPFLRQNNPSMAQGVAEQWCRAASAAPQPPATEPPGNTAPPPEGSAPRDIRIILQDTQQQPITSPVTVNFRCGIPGVAAPTNLTITNGRGTVTVPTCTDQLTADFVPTGDYSATYNRLIDTTQSEITVVLQGTE